MLYDILRRPLQFSRRILVTIGALFQEPKKSCGLRVNEKYRVKRTFESIQRFEEGEIFIFKRECYFGGSDPCPCIVYVPAHEYWVFEIPGTENEKRISGFDFEGDPVVGHSSNPKDWIRYFEEVAKPLEIICAECQKATVFPSTKEGSVQECSHCGAYVDVE